MTKIIKKLNHKFSFRQLCTVHLISKLHFKESIFHSRASQYQRRPISACVLKSINLFPANFRVILQCGLLVLFWYRRISMGIKWRLMENDLVQHEKWSSALMVTSWHGNIFFVIDPLWGESTGVFPQNRASNAELWCLLYFSSEQTVEQALELSVIRDAMMFVWRHCNVAME